MSPDEGDLHLVGASSMIYVVSSASEVFLLVARSLILVLGTPERSALSVSGAESE
jgi:hypothetical protein